jgi:hypothetical protein
MVRSVRACPRRHLLEGGAVLLLEATNLVHVQGVELALGFLLVGGQLLVVLHGLQADGGVVADADDEDAAGLALAAVIVLIGEGDVDLRDVVGGVRGRVGAPQHGLAVAADDEDAGAAVVSGLDGEAAVVALSVVVGRQHLALHAALVGATENPEAGDEEEGKEDEAENDQHHVDHLLVVSVAAVFGIGGVQGGSGVDDLRGVIEAEASLQGSADVVDGRHRGRRCSQRFRFVKLGDCFSLVERATEENPLARFKNAA